MKKIIFILLISKITIAQSLKLDNNSIRIGEQTQLTISYPLNDDHHNIIWPAFNDTIVKGVEIISASPIDTINDEQFTKKKYTTVNPKHFDIIIDGMQMVLEDEDGTAKNSMVTDLSICGKTGTAQNTSGNGEDHSIFIAFAPKNNPKIAIAVYVENGGWGSTWAAPIATLMIEKYLKNEITNL